MFARAAVLALFAVPLIASCAKARNQETPEPASTAPLGVEPATKCRYESVMAASSLDIVGLQAMDVPMDKVKAALVCSGGPIAECAGTVPLKGDPVAGTVAYALSVDGRGFVTEAKVESAGALPASVVECTTQIMKRMDFPAAEKGPTTVKVSFQFGKLRESPRFAGIDVSASTEVLSGKVEREGKAIDAALLRLKGCYLLSLEREALAAGTISFTATVGGTGSVTDLKLVQRGTLTKDAVACVDTVLRATSIPVTGETKLKGVITMKKQAP